MVRSASLFSQVLSVFSRGEFQSAVNEVKAERYAKGFTSWEHLVSMLFCQLAQARSLREICQGLTCCLGKLRHLGFEDGPKRSTLAYANRHRPWELFEKTFHQLLAKCQPLAKGRKKFRFRNKLYSLDSSVIDLSVSLFDWAKFSQTKGAIKLHLLLDHEGYLPTYAVISEGYVHDLYVARELVLPSGSIVVLDRGYTDRQLFARWTEEEVWFVTRLREDILYDVVEERQIPNRTGLLRDQVIRLRNEGCPHPLRRIEFHDAESKTTFVYLTNHLGMAAATVAAIYKDRWQVELFFKALKQNLRIKTFVGTSANAVRIQVWTALIALLLLKYLQFRSRLSWALSNLVALVRWNLFTYRDLWRWLDDPFGIPPWGSEPEQLPLGLLAVGQHAGQPAPALGG